MDKMLSPGRTSKVSILHPRNYYQFTSSSCEGVGVAKFAASSNERILHLKMLLLNSMDKSTLRSKL